MKLLIEIPAYAYERTKEYYNALETGTEVDAEVVYIAEGIPIESPCDLCRYNPPSSGDGKPCSMCPAVKGE